MHLILSQDKARPAEQSFRLQGAAGSAAGGEYSVEVPRVSRGTRVNIDGLTGREWNNAGVADMFYSTEDYAEAQTTVRLMNDQTYLYIIFECEEPEMGGLLASAGRAADVFRDDCVELFISPRGSSYYYQIALNAFGVLYDARVRRDDQSREVEWNSEITVGSFRLENSWAVELAIPFASLGGVPAPGEKWEINFTRQRKLNPAFDKIAENSSWFPMFGAHVPPAFGKMVFK